VLTVLAIENNFFQDKPNAKRIYIRADTLKNNDPKRNYPDLYFRYKMLQDPSQHKQSLAKNILFHGLRIITV
jgi:hypothetical protein